MENYRITEKSMQVQEQYPHNFHKVDKTGMPVYYERLGMIDINKLFSLVDEEFFYKEFLYSCESNLLLRFPVCSDLYNKHVD